ncbi:hypothetical protein D3C77_467710 [compost metagenome]
MPDCFADKRLLHWTAGFAAIGHDHFCIHRLASNYLVVTGISQLIHRFHIDTVRSPVIRKGKINFPFLQRQQCRFSRWMYFRRNFFYFRFAAPIVFISFKHRILIGFMFCKLIRPCAVEAANPVFGFSMDEIL